LYVKNKILNSLKLLMDISMNEIQNITLNCFSNGKHYGSIIKNNNCQKDINLLNDKKFYKKRIIDLTKKIFRNEIEDLELYNSFNSYTKSCIKYLKFLDITDVLQDKYNVQPYISDNNGIDMIGIDMSGIDMSGNENNYDNTKTDLLLTNNNDVKQINLDDFIINNNKKSKEKIIPQTQNINIKTKAYKTKGLKKKKNINNIYEEKNKKE